MTEDQAKQKWCPFIGTAVRFTNIREVTRYLDREGADHMATADGRVSRDLPTVIHRRINRKRRLEWPALPIGLLRELSDLPKMVNPKSPQNNPIGHRMSSANGRASVLKVATVGAGYQPHDEANAGTSTQIACGPAGSVRQRQRELSIYSGVLRLPSFTIRQHT